MRREGLIRGEIGQRSAEAFTARGDTHEESGLDDARLLALEVDQANAVLSPGLVDELAQGRKQDPLVIPLVAQLATRKIGSSSFE